MGCHLIIGIDEAGRGPLAGPVAAAAVALPIQQGDLSKSLRGVRDSKEMSAKQRSDAVEAIKEVALAWGIGNASAREIDSLGIVGATKVAMKRGLEAALEGTEWTPDCLFMDYMLWPECRDIAQVSIVNGDKLSLSIASASVLAKVWRDQFMLDLHRQVPQYDFAQNKGYGTAAHLDALKRYGPCEHHRRGFKPVRDLIGSGCGQ
jgi:ribonuclease HII